MTGEEKCCDEVRNSYYFYLAFENAFCKDYLTEILHGWLYDMIPVVQGRFDDVRWPYFALAGRVSFCEPESSPRR